MQTRTQTLLQFRIMRLTMSNKRFFESILLTSNDLLPSNIGYKSGLDYSFTFYSREVSDIEDLVEKVGSEVLRARDEWGYTPAHWAALDGSVEIMRYLVERSAPVDLPCLGTQGPKPIHWACRKGHTAVVQVLLQAGNPFHNFCFKINFLFWRCSDCYNNRQTPKC